MVSNAAIADKLLGLAQLLADHGGNAFKARAYRRAARTIRILGESFEELVQTETDLTQYPGIGKAIAGAIQEIVRTGTLRQVEGMRSQVGPERAAISEFPGLDAKRVLRVYKKLGISSVAELKEKLESGELATAIGTRATHYIRQALTERTEFLLYEADKMAAAVESFLLGRCRVTRAEAAGDFRRRVEVISELFFLVETPDFESVCRRLEEFGGGTSTLKIAQDQAVFRLPSAIILKISLVDPRNWGISLIEATGSEKHLRKLVRHGCRLTKLAASPDHYPEEIDIYRSHGVSYIDPELREGRDEVERAARGEMPVLISVGEIRGELHAHTTASDGKNTIGQMAAAARKRGYEYIGITDHSQSLKIAGGLSEQQLWDQLREIDQWNERLEGIRVLKSAEVDILADGKLDYPDELLRELDYTVCSIHSRFGLGKTEQTERILRAMDNRYFTILGHATGRLLLKRPGYELDIDRIIHHAQQRSCFFEINSSPDRLDLSAANARAAVEAGIKIAINTDAHGLGDFDLVRYGVDQARRAGLTKDLVLNSLPLGELGPLLAR